MAHLTLTFLGDFQARQDGQLLSDFQTDKVRALLAYLAVEARVHTRSALAALLWPGYSQESARASLRQALAELRITLGDATANPPWLLITRQTIQFNPAAVYTLDVQMFAALVAASADHAHARLADCQVCLARLQDAAALYAGDFLAGFAVNDSAPFEEWRRVMQEQLHIQTLELLADLAHAAEVAGADDRAQEFVRRQLALEPWLETAHRQLMRILTRRGQRSAAIAQYHRCRQVLAEELGVEPDAETTALYDQIRAGKFLDKETGRQGDKEARDGDAALSLSPPLTVSLSAVQDWGAMPAVDHLHGRAAEKAQLENWLGAKDAAGNAQRCRLVLLLGMGGAGKTTLAAAVVKAAAPAFASVIWRSLLNAPPLAEIVQDWLQVLARQTLIAVTPTAAALSPSLPASLDEQLRLLLTCLRQQRCLLVLDNLESIFQPGTAGALRPGYEGYAQLLQHLGESDHQSVLLLTSREQPQAIARLVGQARDPAGRMRILQLDGLDRQAGRAILQAQGLTAPCAEADTLVQHYSGNPLALQLVAQTIQELFAGEIALFLATGAPIFDDIRTVLDQQVARLAPLEQEILFWLAIEPEAITLPSLLANLLQPPPVHVVLDALRALQRRSLLEKAGDGFTLQNVVMEYVTERLVDDFGFWIVDFGLMEEQSKIENLKSAILNRHALLKAQAKEYVRQSQARLILQPIAERLLAKLGRARLIAQIQAILTWLRREAALAPGYAGGNLLNLLLQLRVDLSGYDFSRLSVWQADLRGVTVAELNFGEADLAHSAFTLDFNIFAIMFDQFGQVLVAAPVHGDICLWRVAKGQLHDAFRTASKGGFPLVFSHDGQLLAGCCLDHTVRLWSVESGVTLHILPGHTELANAVAFSPDTQQVVSSGRDNTIRLWDVRSGRCLWVLQHESSGYVPLAYRPAQQGPPLLASGGGDQTICLWDTAQGQVIARLRGHLREIESLAFSPDGGLLASGSHDGTILLWDVRVPGQSQLLGALQGHSQVIRTLVFHPNSDLLASGSADCSIRLWDVNSRQTRQLLLGHASEVTHLAFNPDGSALASSSADRVVRLWDTQSGHALDLLKGYIDAIHTVRFSPDGRQLASGSADGLIRLWDRSNQRNHDRPTRYFPGHVGQVLTVAFSPAPSAQSSQGAALLASGSSDTTVQLWDVATGKTMRTLRGHSGPVKSLAFRGDGQLLASGSADRTIRFWPVAGSAGVAAPQSGRILHGHTDEVATVAFSPDGRMLVSSSFDHTARLWAVESGQEVHVLQGHSAALCAAVFSPNGERVATISYDNTVCLWEVANGRRSEGWDGISAGGRVVAFSPRGDLLVYGIEEVALLIRDLRTGSVLHTLRGHSSTIIALDFSPTEAILASSSWDGTIRLWDLQTGGCLQTLRAPGPYAGMNITGVTGISDAQKAALKALGAVEDMH